MDFTVKALPENTAWQVNTLLNVLNALQPKIEEFEESGKVPMDENVKTSIEGTIIRACNRLDDILDDKARWAMPEDVTPHVHRSIELANMQSKQNLDIVTLQLNGILIANQQKAPTSTVDAEEILPATPAVKPTRRTRKKK